MNFKYFYTTEKIYWNNTSDNKPSYDFLHNIEMKEVDINIAQIDYTNGILIWPNSLGATPTFIRAKQEDTFQDFFYFPIMEKITNKFITYKLILDVWSTYTLILLNRIMQNDTQIKLLRFGNGRGGEIYQPALTSSDPLLDALPKSYSSIEFIKAPFQSKKDGKNIIYYNSYFGFGYNNKDIINGVRYYIFSDAKNGTYTAIPLLSNKSEITFYEEKIEEKLEKTYFINNSQTNYTEYNYHVVGEIINGQEIINNEMDLDNIIREAYANNKRVKYYYYTVGDAWYVASGGTGDHKLDRIWHLNYYGDRPNLIRKSIDNYNEYLPSAFVYRMNLNFNKLPQFNEYLGMKTSAYLYAYGSEISHHGINYEGHHLSFHGESSRSIWPGNNGLETLNKTLRIDIEIYEKIGGESITNTINNNLISIENFKNSAEWSNKFLGIYYLPHILTFKKLIDITNGTSRLKGIEIDHNGIMIDNYYILKREGFAIHSKPNKYNSREINALTLRYMNIKYYNNVIDWSKRGDIYGIRLSGKFYFTSGGVLLSKRMLTSIEESIFSWPYQLPSSVDQYQNYVNANMNSVNTSLEIYKQQRDFSLISKLFNGANISRGESGFNISGNIKNTAFNLIGNQLQYRNKINTLRSQYADYNNTLGQSINNSANTDLMWSNYMNDAEHYEGVELCIPTEDTVKSINNTLYLYGNFVNSYFIFYTGFFQGDKFNYLQCEENDIIEKCANVRAMGEDIPVNMYNEVLKPLIEGVRVCNEKPEWIK